MTKDFRARIRKRRDLAGRGVENPDPGFGRDERERAATDSYFFATVTRFDTKQENLQAAISNQVRDELNLLLATDLANTVDYRDRTSTGWEYQVLVNLNRNWTLLGSYSRNQTEFTRFFPLLGALVPWRLAFVLFGTCGLAVAALGRNVELQGLLHRHPQHHVEQGKHPGQEGIVAILGRQAFRGSRRPMRRGCAPRR